MKGVGEYPDRDPWGRVFNESYYPRRARLAGSKFPGGYRAVLEGVQCDQDYLRVVFNLEHGPSRQKCCHLCHAVQWISNKVHHAYNHPSNLYTVFGPVEGEREILDRNTR